MARQNRDAGAGDERREDGGEVAVQGGGGTFAWIREQLEALLIAVVLAIVIRHFAVEAFEIPTGSMANTLFGMHSWRECANCSSWFNVALQSDSSTGEINVRYDSILLVDQDCPNEQCEEHLHSRKSTGSRLQAAGDRVGCGSCGMTFRGEPASYRWTDATEHDARCPRCGHIARHAVFEKSNRHGGHKILVTKFAYALGAPRRWDVIVFEFDQWKNYIKRLVGLPGERIDVWDGDLYINGNVERKYTSPRVQESLWTELSNTDVLERGLVPPAWAELPTLESKREGPKNAKWNPELKRWSMNATEEPCILGYQRGFDNYYSYNLLLDSELRGSPRDIQVGDKRVAFTARIVGQASGGPTTEEPWIGAEIRDGDFVFEARIPVGPPSEARKAVLARLVVDPGPAPSSRRPTHPSALRVETPASVARGDAVRIEMENVDDRVAVRLDGKEILSLEYRSLPDGTRPQDRPPAPGADTKAHYVRLLASRVQVEFESVQVYRDMYYIPQGKDGPWKGIQLGEKQYFAMGDNAPSSSDGRYWDSIPEDNLMGKALLVFWPAWPLNFQCKFIR